MTIYTSYFGRAKGLKNAVSIAQGTPKWFTGEKYPALAPSWGLVHEKDTTKYRSRYQEEVLKKQNPLKVAEDLEGKVILCWEPPGQFCHRRLVAEWLERNLLMEVPELNFTDTTKGRSKRVACDLSMFGVKEKV